MPSVYAIGETIYDIIFRNGQPVAARPGGSMLNSAVSLGRCGVKVEMITELGDDQVGKIVLDFLHENGVSTRFSGSVTGFKTPVSLAFLDEKGNASYSFYKKYPKKRLEITWPELERGDVVLFGSFYSLAKEIRPQLVAFLKKAGQDGAIIVYDPNIRRNHLAEIRGLMPEVEENISLSDIVRGSDEDFENLFGMKEGTDIFKMIKKSGCNNLVITRGIQGSEMHTAAGLVFHPAKEIETLSTIGAGDAFNAGIIFFIIKNNITVDELVNINQATCIELLDYGTNFAADVCGSLDNYISKETAERFHVENNYK
jgi:fructokinase